MGEKQRGMILFFQFLIFFSAGSLLASEIITLWKIHCNYPLTTKQGDRFASC